MLIGNGVDGTETRSNKFHPINSTATNFILYLLEKLSGIKLDNPVRERQHVVLTHHNVILAFSILFGVLHALNYWE